MKVLIVTLCVVAQLAALGTAAQSQPGVQMSSAVATVDRSTDEKSARDAVTWAANCSSSLGGGGSSLSTKDISFEACSNNKCEITSGKNYSVVVPFRPAKTEIALLLEVGLTIKNGTTGTTPPIPVLGGPFDTTKEYTINFNLNFNATDTFTMRMRLYNPLNITSPVLCKTFEVTSSAGLVHLSLFAFLSLLLAQLSHSLF